MKAEFNSNGTSGIDFLLFSFKDSNFDCLRNVDLFELRELFSHKTSNKKSFADIDGKAFEHNKLKLLDKVHSLFEVDSHISFANINLIFKDLVIFDQI